MQRELNLFVLVQQIRKLKAGLSVLIGNDQEKIEEASLRYLEYSTIQLDRNNQGFEKIEAPIIRKDS
jgi:hypothetical protein